MKCTCRYQIKVGHTGGHNRYRHVDDVAYIADLISADIMANPNLVKCATYLRVTGEDHPWTQSKAASRELDPDGEMPLGNDVPAGYDFKTS